jgi:hypothetical protein
MATQAEYTIGTNAAIPQALNDVWALIPGYAQGVAKQYVTYQTFAPIVADIVKTALDAVDANRAKTTLIIRAKGDSNG